MLLKTLFLLTSGMVLAGCAHHTAIRVDCNGHLRPINGPLPYEKSPASVSSEDPHAK